MLTLYDFNWKLTKGVNWHPHVAKILPQLQGSRVQNHWIEYPEIEGIAKGLGVKPTGVKSNGDPEYTLPMLVDDSTGVALADHALQAAFRDAFYPKLGAYVPFLVPTAVMVCNPPGEVYLRTKFEKKLGMKIEDFYPKDEARVVAWNKWKAEVGSVAAWFRKEDVWVMGDTPSFADFILAAFILSAKTLFGADSMEYKEILEINDGRWGRLAKNVEKYDPNIHTK
ncbi:hypothetical protein BT96DRAFT_1023691 [Gymnopus androsaceus JB14]|uniref:Glutathione S-transferase UstS-like C-terminal domain-containing protein n=1 Tax=Gymnopus androsaceus JB14 TaxID=1447944 RepID=A0A6A4H4L6_9AGAR|nr:hypothetical protein BT96DRAFT_1023691 [Gymnopus androsaceus JB14]